MAGEWPVCKARLTMFGQDMTCHLPKHHERDGEEMHEDPDKGRWLLTAVFGDGTERRV